MISATVEPTFPLDPSSLEPCQRLQYRPLEEGHILRREPKPERDHPEAKHREEAQEPERHEKDAEPDAQGLRLRQVPVAVEEANFVGHLTGPSLTGADFGHKGLARAPQWRPARAMVAKLWKAPRPFAI